MGLISSSSAKDLESGSLLFLGEPAVNFGEYRTRLVVLALLREQPRPGS